MPTFPLTRPLTFGALGGGSPPDPEPEPGPPTDITLSSATTTVDAIQGSAIGAFTSTDPDVGDTFTYSFVAPNSHSSNKVQLSGASLQVGSAVPLSAGTFDITVRSTDSDALTFDKSFTITVTAANDDAPLIEVLLPMQGL